VTSIHSILQRFRQRDRLALARLLTWVARGEHLDTIRHALNEHSGPPGPRDSSLVTRHSSSSPRIVAITGSGGVGKSTLIGKLIEAVRSNGQTVAILACDPQSSLTGGALLGDRVRMPSRPDDEGVFIRSLAIPHGNEAIAPNVDLMIRLLGTFGFSTVILETAGAGQGDTAVRKVADVVVVLVQPETGDELQWEKAGLLEIADVVVVHKADLPGAERVESDLRELLNLPGCRPVPVLRASASKGQGLEDLWLAIEESVARRR
jgi:LAO/AO transport system kinase